MNKPINTKPMFTACKILKNAEDSRKYANLRLSEAENDACRDLNVTGTLCANPEALNAWHGGHVVHMRKLSADAERRYLEALAAFTAVVKPLTDAIKAAEGRATARTISASRILDILEGIEYRLHISKKALEGVTVHVDDHAQKFPNSYKYVPESTHFIAVYKAGTWRVTDIHRGTCTTCESTVDLTDAAKAAIIDRFSRNV